MTPGDHIPPHLTASQRLALALGRLRPSHCPPMSWRPWRRRRTGPTPRPSGSGAYAVRLLPVDILKIDRSFVSELNGTSEGAAITDAVIRLSRLLRLDTIAEGVEEIAQIEELAALGCVNGQGYYFAKPMTSEQIDALLVGGDGLSPVLPAAARIPVGQGQSAS